jgi:hypothetical protein
VRSPCLRFDTLLERVELQQSKLTPFCNFVDSLHVQFLEQLSFTHRILSSWSLVLRLCCLLAVTKCSLRGGYRRFGGTSCCLCRTGFELHPAPYSLRTTCCFAELKRPGSNTTYRTLVPKLRMHGAISRLRHTFSLLEDQYLAGVLTYT